MAKSTNKDPRKVVIDLVQKEYKKLYQRNDEGLKDKLEHIKGFHIRPRLPADKYPSLHCYFDTTFHDQRGIKQKVSVDKHQLNVSFYGRHEGKLWNVHQSIKEIIVGNNKVASTKQIASTGVEIINVDRTEWFSIMEGKEKVVYYFVMEVVVTLQESYHTI